jgi:hypothetical protein
MAVVARTSMRQTAAALSLDLFICPIGDYMVINLGINLGRNYRNM